ncbi:hypothetical protein BH10BAC5_BH10BAC5_08260 [soil metagenome]
MDEKNPFSDNKSSVNNSSANEKRKSSVPEFLTKPVIRSDSKLIQYSGLGIQLAAVILIFLFVGMWLDGKLGTGYLFTLSLTFIGFFGGFYSFYLSIMKMIEDEKQIKKDRESNLKK